LRLGRKRRPSLPVRGTAAGCGDAALEVQPPQRGGDGKAGEATVNGLLNVLQERRKALEERWAELVFASYPQQSAPFLRQERDRFANLTCPLLRYQILC